MKFVKLLAKVALILGLIVALTVLVLYRMLKEPARIVGHEEIERQEGVAVELESPERRDFAEYLFCDGTVEAKVRAVLRAEVGETIKAIHVDVGDAVAQGELLLEFRKTDLEAEVQARRAAYDEARNNYQRYEALFEDRVVSRDVLEARRTVMQAAAAALQRAESEMKFTEVRAPIGALPGKPEGRVYVEARYVELGEHMGVGDKLLMLVDLSQMEVRAQVPETGVSLAKPGATAEFRLEGEQTWQSGAVMRIGPSTENPNRFYEVFVKTRNERRNEQWLMRSGMYVEVRLLRATAKGALSVRASAIRQEGEKEYVFVVRKALEESAPAASPEKESREGDMRAKLRRLLGLASSDSSGQGTVASQAPSESHQGAPKEGWKAHQVAVKTGLRGEGFVQLLEGGVSPDALIVASPRDELSDGIKVRIVKGSAR